ncbi:MAG: hypothetical protein ACOC8P_00370 [Dichotomicrobium sp.]
MTDNITPINGSQVEHIAPGDPVEVLFAPGWAKGWKLVGIDDGLLTVRRTEDGAWLNGIGPERVRAV